MFRFLADEDVPESVLNAVREHNASGSGMLIELIAVGEPGAPLKGTLDPDLLVWAEREGRLIVTRDVSTMPQHLANHLAAGRHSPGVLRIRAGQSNPRIVEALELIAHAGEPEEFADQYRFIPL